MIFVHLETCWAFQDFLNLFLVFEEIPLHMSLFKALRGLDGGPTPIICNNCDLVQHNTPASQSFFTNGLFILGARRFKQGCLKLG